MAIRRSGRELKELRDTGTFSDAHVLVLANVSMTTLHKIYRDVPTVRPKIRNRVEEAILNLSAQGKAAG